MKCRFCGKKLKKNAAYCSACGKAQSYDALPEGEDYETYEDSYEDVPYTDYEDVTDYGDDEGYVPPVTPKKSKAKLPLPLILGVAAAALALLLVIGLFAGGGEEYPLLWPDFMSWMGEDRYTVKMHVSDLELNSTTNNGEHGYIYKVWINKSDVMLLEEYLELLEEYHFELNDQRDGIWFYTFTGSNAPDQVTSNDSEYHCLVAVEEENDTQMLIRCVWMDPFERDTSVSNPSKQHSGQNTATRPVETEGNSKAEYPLYWPDFMKSLEKDTYTQELVTVKITHKGEKNYGLTGYMGKVCVHEDADEQIRDFIDEVQREHHFELVFQENGKYFFRFTGSNAPVTIKGGNCEYHCSISTEKKDNGVLVTYSWMTDFATNPSNAKMEPTQTAVKPMPEETEPVETKPVETRPVETTQPKSNFSASYLPYFLDEDRSNKFVLGYTEKLSDGDRVIFRVSATGMEYIVEEYIEMMCDLGYQVVSTDGKDRNTWYVREWYLTCDKLPDSGKDWHVHIHVMGDIDDKSTSLTIDMIGGVKMDQVLPESTGGGGGGSDWDDDDEDKYRPNCAMCGGDGKCDGCGGDGYVWSYGMDRERLNCSDCNASGRCRYCGGSGKR